MEYLSPTARVENLTRSSTANNRASCTRERMPSLEQMRRELGNFSYLPPLSKEQVAKQVQSLLTRELVPIIEYTRRPEPKDHDWSMWEASSLRRPRRRGRPGGARSLSHGTPGRLRQAQRARP